MTGTIAVIMIFSIPIIAIIGGIYSKIKTEEIQSRGSGDPELRKQIGYLLAQQEEMQEQIKQLQYLASQSNAEKEPLDLEAKAEPIEMPERLKNPKDFNNNSY